MASKGSRTPVYMELDEDLWRAAKIEARRQGLPLRVIVSSLLVGWLQDQPSWRSFLAEQSVLPEAKARGRLLRRH